MSQLFTLHFPKYHFILPREFTITFSWPLPFSYALSKHNVVYVDAVDFDKQRYTVKQIDLWQRKGLQPGLRIVKINNKTLIENGRHQSELADSPINSPQQLLAVEGTINSIAMDTPQFTFARSVITAEQFDDLQRGINLSRSKQKEISFTFREEIVFMENSVSLGLEYKADCEMKSNEPFIENHQISVSGFDDEHDATQCRLNNPHNYWSPSVCNERARDVWICCDLRMKKYVDKIYIQGSPDHQQYVKSLRIDYSDDGCVWKSHSSTAIDCKYQAKKGSSCSSGSGRTQSLTAVISIYPMIHAQFVRIRPYEWHNRIALRMDLCGPSEETVEFGKVVTLSTVSHSAKSQLETLLRGMESNTKAIQVNCKAVVSAALDGSGCDSYAVLNADKSNYLCVFTTPNADISERAMDQLAAVGIGNDFGQVSAASILYRNASESIERANSETKTGFYSTIKSRMVVKQVVERIINSAAFTFDYVCMLTVASMIAVGGLATNNSVIVVASMLVSPIMGPVLALIFGATLRDKYMAKIGIFNELLSLLGCIVIGFIVGFFYALGTKNRNAWPTQEMYCRGQPWGLLDGAYIAAASGVGVALSVLGDYLSTLVGVAISASLQPPAVNCGMLLSFVLYEIAFPQYVHQDGYPEYVHAETLKMAVISLILTIENIIIIFCTARLMFVVKNVYIAGDHNANVWRSVTNLKSEYTKMRDLQHEREASSADRARSVTIDMSKSSNRDKEQSHSDGSRDNFHVYTETGTTADRCVQRMKSVLFAEEQLTGSLRGTLLQRQRQMYLQHTSSVFDEDEDIGPEQVSSARLLTPKTPHRAGNRKRALKNKRYSPLNSICIDAQSDADRSALRRVISTDDSDIQ